MKPTRVILLLVILALMAATPALSQDQDGGATEAAAANEAVDSAPNADQPAPQPADTAPAQPAAAEEPAATQPDTPAPADDPAPAEPAPDQAAPAEPAAEPTPQPQPAPQPTAQPSAQSAPAPQPQQPAEEPPAAPAPQLTGPEQLLVHGADASQWPLVHVFLNIRQGGGLRQDLQPDEFSAYVDSENLAVLSVGPREAESAREAVLFSVDTSGTMRGAPLVGIREALTQLAEKKGENDLFGLMDFNDDVFTRAPLSEDRQAFLDGVNALEASGRITVLFKALFEGLTALDVPGLPAQRYLVVLSDGKDEGEGFTLDDAIEQANKLGVPVYALGMVTTAERRYLDNMERLARLTGGDYITVETPDQLPAAFQQISAPILNQQVLTLRADSDGDGRDHTVQVRFTDNTGQIQTFPIRVSVPQVVLERPEPEPEPVVEPEPAPVEEPAAEEETDNGNKRLILILGGCAIVVIVAALLLIMIRRNRQQQVMAGPEPMDFGSMGGPMGGATQAERQPTQVQDMGAQAPPSAPRQATMAEPPASAWRLVVESHNIVAPLRQGSLTVGANPENQIVVDEETVSGFHLEITGNGNKFMIKDLGSTNGTFINGVQLTAPTLLGPGDLVKLGRVMARIVVDD